MVLYYVLALVLLAALNYVAPYLTDQKGYVLIAMGNTTIEATVVSLSITLIMALIISILGWKLLRWAFSFTGFFKCRASAKWQQSLQRGVEAWLLEDYRQAVLHLRQVPEAHGFGHFAQTLMLSALAKLGQKESLQGKALDKLKAPALQAKLRLEAGDVAGAEQALAPLLEQRPSVEVLFTALALYRQQHKWQAIIDLYGKQPLLLNRKAAAQQDFYQWFLTSTDAGVLQARFKQLPKKLQALASVPYCQAMLQQHEGQVVQSYLEKWVKQQRFTELLQVLAHCRQALPNLRGRLQQFVQKQEQHEPALRCLALLGYAEADYEFTAKVLKRFVSEHSAAEDKLWLARCYTEVGENHLALKLYQSL